MRLAARASLTPSRIKQHGDGPAARHILVGSEFDKLYRSLDGLKWDGAKGNLGKITGWNHNPQCRNKDEVSQFHYPISI